MSTVRGSRSRPPGRWTTVLGGAVVPLAIVAVWWSVSAIAVLSPHLLPSPQDVVIAGIELAERGRLFEDAGVSIQRVLVGYIAGSAAGLLLGSAVRGSRTARILFSPVISAVRAVPTVAWLPLLLLYLGIGEAPKVALIAIGAAFPVFSAVAGAPDDGDPDRPPLEAAIASGLRTALTQAWAFMVTAELLSATAGIGFLLISSSNSGRADRVLVGIVLIVVLARLSDLPMAWLERRLRNRSPVA